MRKLCLVAIVVLAPMSVFAQAGIRNSPHDFSSSSTGSSGSNYDRICAFCHTPHNANTTNGLWNRAMVTGTGLTYDVGTTTAGTVLNGTSVGDASARCLSCHDGTVAIGSLSNPPRGAPTTILATGVGVDLSTPGELDTGYAYFDRGAMDHNHPISVPYDNGSTYLGRSSTVIDGEYVNPGADGKIGTTGVRLYGAANAWGIECSSCHNPHSWKGAAGDREPFLVRANAASALCTTCHNK